MNMKETVRTVEAEKNAPVDRKEYEKPRLAVYEGLKSVTGQSYVS
jgi:hypothetical protein